MILNRENVANSVVMIQPSLISYSFQSVPEPALLDVAAIAADRILLLDSYFTIVIFHGSTIAQWRKAGYHYQPEHQVIFLNFRIRVNKKSSIYLSKEWKKKCKDYICRRFDVGRILVFQLGNCNWKKALRVKK